jgi:DNA-binding FadR family transcriptional regulator
MTNHTPFKPLPSKRVFEQVADQIRKLIMAGVFTAGDKLPPEKELAVHFNVGRAALREALRVLEGEGLIQVKQGSEGGSFINRPNLLTTPKSVIDNLISKIKPSHIREMRSALELGMLPAVLQRITNQDIKRLEKTIADAGKIIEDGEVPSWDISVFHLQIARASKNPLYEVVLSSMVNVSLHVLSRGENRRDWLGAHLQQHKDILEGLRQRDFEQTRKALENHIGTITDNMQKAINGKKAKRKSKN